MTQPRASNPWKTLVVLWRTIQNRWRTKAREKVTRATYAKRLPGQYPYKLMRAAKDGIEAYFRGFVMLGDFENTPSPSGSGLARLYGPLYLLSSGAASVIRPGSV